ncbi:C-type lectin 7 [Aphelenchoides avenae]|nr:C-type lectin 7 [Aphelenchus avenae]
MRRIQVLFFLFALATVQGMCPPGSIQGLSKWKCYKLVTYAGVAYFLDAESACRDYGGSLTSVADAFENAFLKDMLKVVAPGNDIWIGGTNIISPGRWNWTDGKPFAYTNWETNQPGTSSGQCLAMSVDSGTWHAVGCASITKWSICEIGSINGC